VVTQGQWGSKGRGLERLAGVGMVVEIMRNVVVVCGFRMASRPLFSDEFLRSRRRVVIVFLVEVREWFAEVFDLEVWSDRPEVEGVALDGTNEAW
jgi:hypothetical protein